MDIRFTRTPGLRAFGGPRRLEGETLVCQPRPVGTVAAGRGAQVAAPNRGLDADRKQLGGGLAPALLGRTINDAAALLSEVRARQEPTTAPELVDVYATIGSATATAEAVLLAALDALDANIGGGRAQPAAPFAHLRARALAMLREAGVAFAALEGAFTKIVHGSVGWARQPVERDADRGDGRPLFVYRNTFKKNAPLSDVAQRAEYRSRVDKFDKQGGRFEDIIVADRSTFAKLECLVPYDYVLSEDGTLRLFPTLDTDADAAKPGHSLLAEGGRVYTARCALLAGELWVIKDSAGDVEGVLVANNSGHFKPEFADLANALPHLAALGIEADKVVLFGGPNNLPSMFAEMEQRCGLKDLNARLPPAPSSILEALAAKKTSALAVRFP